MVFYQTKVNPPAQRDASLETAIYFIPPFFDN